MDGDDPSLADSSRSMSTAKTDVGDERTKLGMRPSTILLVADHAFDLEQLTSLLRDEFALVGTVTDGSRLVETARLLRPDVIVTDLAMPGLSGLDGVRRLKAETIPARVIVLAMHAEATLAAQALRAGAAGFVVKPAAGKELIAAIHTALRGGRYLPPYLADDVLVALTEGEAAGGGDLTPRQREVVSLIAEGKTMKEIGAALGVSPRTVETHKYQAMQELGLPTTAGLIRYAIEHRIARPAPRG